MYFTNFGLGAQVDAARAKYKIIKPPNMYATKGMFFTKGGEFDEKGWVEIGEAFNRRQRGHQHLHESLADAYALMILCGLFYPLYSAKLSVLYCAGSIVYAIGYAIAPQHRLWGEVLYFPALFGWMYGLYCAGTMLQTL